jgi:lysine-ketoglutarate reductase/saccharopine dehydrogenase-like protein (TIGR00300 family)
MEFRQDVEVRGHLIDSAILSKIMDVVMELGGAYDILEMTTGRRKQDASFARLTIQADTQNQLDKILAEVYREGATTRTPREVRLEEAARDMVMPDNFYSTTNNRTRIFHGGKWIDVDNTMMDKCVVVQDGYATCVPIRDVRRGDMIVVGEEGIMIVPPERPRGAMNVFEFMGSGSSSERPTRNIARQVAADIIKTRKAGGKIILVGGPAIVHTGAADMVAELIRGGYIQGLLAGNALAVHDIEYATMGTSLGMNIIDGTLAIRGHRNHIDAVNSVFKAGSIPDMVRTGRLKSGIMYECVKNGVPFVLAGSIRDDGPLPDVITDVVEAQRQYKKIVKDAEMVIMASTMLHSIATGNMLPADVKVIVMDINQSAVTKLMDRGTWQALGVVTDVGAFLLLVANEIRALQ